MRTTVDIDPLVLAALRERQKREGTTLGVLVSELLTKALAQEEAATPTADFHWPSASMGARIDINDKEALWAVLDESLSNHDVRDR